MKTRTASLFSLMTCLSLFCFQAVMGQQTGRAMLFRSGALLPQKNLLLEKKDTLALGAVRFNHSYYVLLQFNRLPDAAEKSTLASAGIRLFDYLPGNAYLAELTEDFQPSDLRNHAVGGLYLLPQSYKWSPGLRQYSGTLDAAQSPFVAVGFFGTMPAESVAASLEAAGASIVHTRIQPKRAFFVRASQAALNRIAALPFVSYLGLQSLKPVSLNNNNRAAHGIDALGAPPGRNLQGQGVTLGIGDNSDPYTHIDFAGRLIDRCPDSIDDHGTHTTGTMAGGGILNPMYQGMAPQATIVSQEFTDILVNAPTYIGDYDMVLTSNSYTDALNGCLGEGEYDYTSNYVDDQMTVYTSLMHDFAAGNDGQISCFPYPSYFGTVKSGLQCAKNILAAGNLDNIDYTNYVINPSSSRGPAADGRIKPEIMTGGTNIFSTYPYNSYAALSGTSMSCPTLTGALGLLYQRYRQLNGGVDPAAALMKTIVCNTATDLGNPGPDYTFGFGMLNARAAVEAMENNQYFSGSINNGGHDTYTISGVPAGTQQVKIMLYWADPAAAPFAATTLVNNLDLTVVSPDGITHLPLILNSNPGNVNDNAAEGVDSLNNIEQVVINTPPGGNFTVKVAGTSIPMGPQPYFISYQIVQPSVKVEYPFGGETLVPGLTEDIRWTAFGGDPNTFTIEYSPDNGATWNTINNAVPATTRIYPWTVPATATNKALIRITRNGAGYVGLSTYPFTILGQPSPYVTPACQGYANLIWYTIPSATSYDILELKGDTMQVIANTTDTTYLLGNLNRDSTYWLSVRALNGVNPGRRGIASSVQPNSYYCAVPALDGDMSVDSLVAPLTGRQFTSTQLGSATPVEIEFKNIGMVATGSTYTVSYQVNGGAVVTETPGFVVNANYAYTHTFATTYDFSAPGVYTLKAWISNPGDPNNGNDTLTTVIRQLTNAPLTLNPSFTEGFESAAAASYTAPVTGFTGLDRCDFAASNPNGRARTFINTGFARTGDRCATLDQSHFSDNSTADSLTTTFNLSGYTATDQIWLDFFYQNQGIDFTLPGNEVWIRGNDQAAWIPVYTLNATPASIGGYQPSAHIDVRGILAAASPVQTVSSSFQVRFGEQGYASTNNVVIDGDLDDGYSFDDITLTKASNDVGMVSLVTPDIAGICNLSNAEAISVKVKNYSNSSTTNIPISYSLNGGAAITETIPSIGAFDSVTYTFTHTADLSAIQSYSLLIWVKNPGDSYTLNDTLPVVSFRTQPLLNSFPYLEGFETSDGNWYTGGINSSWQWGTPLKTVINRCANGNKCWVTNLTGDYNDNELSYLYSPCFDLSSLHSPVLSFSHIFQTEDDCDCDYHWAEYSTDGVNWNRLGTVDSGTNWYDDSLNETWQLSDTKWHVSSYDIPTTASKVRFRIVMSSDPATTYEGVAVDDVHIFDKAPIYKGPDLMGGGLSQTVNGNGWVDFSSNGSDRVVSLNPNGQDLGTTTVSLYIDPGSVRNDGKQYYLDRNIVIQPANPPTGNVGVRFYFLDSEAQALLNATGCPSCTTIYDPYEAGVMQYSSPVPQEEDSTLQNDSSGTFHYLASHTAVSIIPYDQGYYAEYQVGGFSEFWINNGTPGQGQPYPFALLSFTAAKAAGGALLQWSTTEEATVSRYVLEKSTDGVSFAQSIDSLGPTGAADSNAVNNYKYTDNSLANGITYYRLKIELTNGQIKYSPIRSLNDTLNNQVVRVYPNPALGGVLYVSTSVNCQEIRVIDASGRILETILTHGLFNTIPLDRIAKGIYFIDILTDGGKSVQKVLVVK